jgi:dihydrofolate reductase
MPVRYSLLAAVAANGVIGVNGDIPWHLPDDLAHFKRTTTDHPVVMGRTTYESIVDRLGGPLPNRTNIVLTTGGADQFDHDVLVVDGLPVAEGAAEGAADALGVDTAYVIGGAQVYEQFLPVAEELVLSELHAEYDGDTMFPEWDRSEWREHTRVEYDAFDIVTYRPTAEES